MKVYFDTQAVAIRGVRGRPYAAPGPGFVTGVRNCVKNEKRVKRDKKLIKKKNERKDQFSGEFWWMSFFLKR